MQQHLQVGYETCPCLLLSVGTKRAYISCLVQLRHPKDVAKEVQFIHLPILKILILSDLERMVKVCLIICWQFVKDSKKNHWLIFNEFQDLYNNHINVLIFFSVDFSNTCMCVQGFSESVDDNFAVQFYDGNCSLSEGICPPSNISLNCDCSQYVIQILIYFSWNNSVSIL